MACTEHVWFTEVRTPSVVKELISAVLFKNNKQVAHLDYKIQDFK